MLKTLVAALVLMIPGAPTLAQDAEQAIAAQGRAFSEAYLSRDTATIGQLYTADAVLMPPGRTVRGRAAIQRYFSGSPNRVDVSHSMETDDLVIRGEVAVETGRWVNTWRRAGESEENSASERYLIVWVREADGEWRMSHDVWHRP